MANSAAYMRQYMKQRYYERRSRIFKILGGKCVKCGATDDLEIDHKKEKNFNVSKMWSISWDRVLKELKLCQLLCRSCHKAKHRVKKHGTLSMYRYCKCKKCRAAKAKWQKEWRRCRNG